ncbi:uncharacterized protein B0T15DRAFT_511009 [Chaetomium strumarium]|uniref:Uncharacterized protein n=1 Tax=Chaetomium strumarium TaxID=1170767 RepID=A0AAJ0GRX1_9PEZI|nr:hypothetical protein B0T15DRAFT_511009 [Chaetomium strumarium]
MIPKRVTNVNNLVLLRRPANRSNYLSTTAAAFRASPAPPQRDHRPSASSSYGPNDPRGGSPVDDIDVVFDFPSEGQASYQKRSLDESGLDIHSAMPHHQRGAAAAAAAGMKRGGGAKEMAEGNVMYVLLNQVLFPYGYIGLGALGLGGLYMVMRRRGPSPKAA